MSKLITQIKRLALALCFVTPLVSWAGVDYTGTDYEPWSGVAGGVVWRATQATFHDSTVADIAANGTVGEAYAMKADQSANSWKRFGSNQSAYSAPGMLLVYDKASSDDETPVDYTQSSEAQFFPLSFGGIWVKTLASNNEPFTIGHGGSRSTEFGNASYAGTSLFKFEKSFTIDRQGKFSFNGTVNVDVAQDAVFKINPSWIWQTIEVPSGSTLKPTGDGEIEFANHPTSGFGTGLTVNGTLDLSAETVPTISGNVTLSTGATLVVPENTTAIEVCSGTLTVGEILVKIGDDEPAVAEVTTSGGSITSISVVTETEKTFTSDYPSEVPYGYTYTYEATEAVTIPAVTVNGTLKTKGSITLSGLTTAAESMLEVVDGTATVTASSAQALAGDIKIDAGATMVNAFAADALNYGWGEYIHVYGTLDMQSTRWTVGSNARIYLYEGGLITGAGQGSNGAIDITSANVRVIASGDSTISANMRVRAENIPVEATEGKTLTISGLINDGVSYSQPGSITKQNSGTLVLTTAPTFTKALKLEAGTLELGGTAVAANVTVTSSSATVVAAENSVLTGDLTFVAHVPSAANKALIVSDSFTGKVILNGDFGSSNYVSLLGLGNAVTLKDFTGFLNQGWDATNVKITIEGTFTQSNGWSGSDSDVTQNAVYIAELLGSGTMTQNGAQKQSYIVGNIANFTGTFNFANSRVKSNNNAVLDKAQTVATLTVAGTLAVNGGSLTGNLVANNVAVTVEGTPTVGDVLVPVTGTVSVSGTVTVNGDEVAFECVTGEGIKLAASTVTVTVPAVPNTTVVVTANGETVTGDNGSYVVPEGSEVVATYTAVDGYEMTGTASYTIDSATEGAAVTPEITTTPYVAKIDGGASYTSLQAAIDATAQTNSKIVLLANEEDGATVPSVNGKAFFIYAGEFTHGTIANAEGNFITTVTEQQVQIGDEDVTATKYRVEAVFMAVTIETVRTHYGQASANDAIAAANNGPLGTTVEFFSGDPASYAAYLPMFTYNEKTGIYTKTLEPVAAVYSGVQQLSVHTTLADAIEAAEGGQTVKLLSNISVTSMQVVDKTMTLDLNGFAITEGTWTDAAITANDDAILCVVHGGLLTVNDSSDGKTGAITAGGVKATSAIKMTKIGDTDDTNKAILVVNAGTLTGYYYAVSGNGSTGRGNTEVTINGGTLRGTCVDDSVAIFNPQAGTLTIAGGYLEGAMGVYVKSGTATVTVTAGTIKGVGTKTAYKASKNGFNNTGDAFVVDNVGYPGGAPAPSILGGTLVSVNASAIASYSAFGNARITKFAAASLKTSGITEAVASSADVFDDYVDEVPVTPGAQTEPVETAEAAQAEAAKVVPSVPTAVAEALSDDQETAYKALFEAKVVEVTVEKVTKYAVEVVLKDSVAADIQTAVDAEAEDLAKAAVEAAADAVAGGEATVTTKPGLYYVVEAGTELDGIEPASCTLATSESTTLPVPNKGAKGFYKISVSVTPVDVE